LQIGKVNRIQIVDRETPNQFARDIYVATSAQQFDPTPRYNDIAKVIQFVLDETDITKLQIYISKDSGKTFEQSPIYDNQGRIVQIAYDNNNNKIISVSPDGQSFPPSSVFNVGTGQPQIIFNSATIPPIIPEKPTEMGKVKEGGWGANNDAKVWKVAKMQNPPNLFKVVDDKGVNVATDFTTEQNAQKYIDFKLKEGTLPDQGHKLEPGNGPTIPPGNRKEKTVNYPQPKTTDSKARSIQFDSQAASKNKGTKLSGKLPLLPKTDTYGVPYTDIPALTKQLGYTFSTVKDYKYANEKTEVKENNNSGGESKRFDMKATFMPQFEYTIKLKNESGDDGDETSLKAGGPHSDDINYQADCFIIQLSNDGKSARTQLEPSHMDKDPHGYGDLFNEAKLDLPRLAGKEYAVRFIKLNDLDNKRVIGIVAIDLLDGNGFNLVYSTEVYDGMGGGRGLKDPYRQWVKTALDDLNACTITIRMDAQPKTTIQKGKHYNNARITEIVDYE
jgi:hypothetical protein